MAEMVDKLMLLLVFAFFASFALSFALAVAWKIFEWIKDRGKA